MVDVRRRGERRVGKPVAAAIALLMAVRQPKPLRLIVDGRVHHMAMMFVGNCRYQPHGCSSAGAPVWMTAILDLQMITLDGRVPLVRLAVAILTGRLGHSRLCTEDDPVDLRVSMPEGPSELVTDGGIRPGHTEIYYTKRRRSLIVYEPPNVHRFPK